MENNNLRKMVAWTIRPKDPSLQDAIQTISSISKNSINAIINDCLQEHLIEYAIKYKLIKPEIAKTLELKNYNPTTPINDSNNELTLYLIVDLLYCINYKINALVQYILSSKTEEAKNELKDENEWVNEHIEKRLTEEGYI